MTAGVINLEIEQGATFNHVIQWFNPDGVTPINLTGCTARSHWRDSIDTVEPLLTLTTENNRIEIEALTGKITLHLSAIETEALTFTAAIYDLEVVFPEVNGEIHVSRVAKGKVKISKEITR